ncbi:MAG: hypothetical protein NC095_08240 [Muribaculum sp.]|nr:hypothetical protein [Muribaculum sp.]
MDGKTLRTRILKIEPKLSDVAKKLNVKPQSLNQTLNADDIKTGFIEQLVEIYDMPFSYFFGESKNEELKIDDHSKYDDHSAKFGSKTEHYENSGYEILLAKLKMAENKIESLKEQISTKDETISTLRADVESKQKMLDYLMEIK